MPMIRTQITVNSANEKLDHHYDLNAEFLPHAFLDSESGNSNPHSPKLMNFYSVKHKFIMNFK